MATSLPPPGDLLYYHFLDSNARSDSSIARENRKELRLLQWNIERGYQLPRIIQQLEMIDADIISLQVFFVLTNSLNRKLTFTAKEVTSSLINSFIHKRDVGYEIAKALKLNYVYVSEFEEIHSPIRDPGSQVSSTKVDKQPGRRNARKCHLESLSNERESVGSQVSTL